VRGVDPGGGGVQLDLALADAQAPEAEVGARAELGSLIGRNTKLLNEKKTNLIFDALPLL
jgi:hypothetical protein